MCLVVGEADNGGVGAVGGSLSGGEVVETRGAVE